MRDRGLAGDAAFRACDPSLHFARAQRVPRGIRVGRDGGGGSSGRPVAYRRHSAAQTESVRAFRSLRGRPPLVSYYDTDSGPSNLIHGKVNPTECWAERFRGVLEPNRRVACAPPDERPIPNDRRAGSRPRNFPRARDLFARIPIEKRRAKHAANANGERRAGFRSRGRRMFVKENVNETKKGEKRLCEFQKDESRKRRQRNGDRK